MYLKYIILKKDFLSYRKYFKRFLYTLFLLIFLTACNNQENKIMIFAGSASQPATEEIAELFEKETGIKTDIIFGGSGSVLSNMIISKQGDIYFPGSSDFMEIAKQKDVIFPETEQKVCYLVSALNVQRGNPKKIFSLKDLLRDDIKVAIANPEGVCVGSYAVEIIEKNFTKEEQNLLRNKLVNYTGSCSKTATAVSLKSVDAVIGWRVFEFWDDKNIETVKLAKEEIVRVGYIPVAISKFTKNKETAQKFIDFLISEKGKNIFRKYHYLGDEKEAFDYIGESKPVGGIYAVPDEWIIK